MCLTLGQQVEKLESALATSKNACYHYQRQLKYAGGVVPVGRPLAARADVGERYAHSKCVRMLVETYKSCEIERIHTVKVLKTFLLEVGVSVLGVFLTEAQSEVEFVRSWVEANSSQYDIDEVLPLNVKQLIVTASYQHIASIGK
jgi:hypothetical protein